MNLDIFPLKAEIPSARFHEKEKPNFLLPMRTPFDG
jgi:hypothetical protein